MNKEQAIEKTKQYIENVLKQEFKNYTRLKEMPLKIRYSNRMKRAICTTKEHRACGRTVCIEFIWSNKVINEYYKNLKLIKGILYHELAHAIVGAEHHHDCIWRAQAAKLGGIVTRSVNCKNYE